MKLTKEVFGNKLRLRVSGLCYKDDSILLIKHSIDGQILWAPPGGGVNFGEYIEEALIREFKEETNLNITPADFLFFTEFIQLPLHAIELFYKVESYSGVISVGNDPEMGDQNIIQDVEFYTIEQINKIPQDHLHSILRNCNNLIELLDKRGQLK